jgi:hypothetical protein
VIRSHLKNQGLEELVVYCFKPATSPEPEDGEDPEEVEPKRAVASRAYEVVSISLPWRVGDV